MKDMKAKRDRDLAARDEKIKEQQKALACFTEAAEVFDVQRKRAQDREKALLDERNA